MVVKMRLEAMGDIWGGMKLPRERVVMGNAQQKLYHES